MLHRLLSLLLGTCLALLFLEGALHALAWLPVGAESRSIAAQPKRDGAFRILCVGDSNTYGAGVSRNHAYPQRLERILNQAPTRGAIEVVNLGVPGTNSSQVANRLPDYLDLYDPDLVIVLIGYNDYWNPAETDLMVAESSRAQDLHVLLMKSRLYRFVFLTLDLLGNPRDAAPEGSAQLRSLSMRRELGGDADEAVREIRHGGRTFRFRNRRIDPVLKVDVHRKLLASNLERIQRTLKSVGVPLVLPTYASGLGRYEVANTTIEAFDDVALQAQQRFRQIRDYLPLPLSEYTRRQDLFFSDLHPKPPVYEAYARSLCNALLSERLVPADRC